MGTSKQVTKQTAVDALNAFVEFSVEERAEAFRDFLRKNAFDPTALINASKDEKGGRYSAIIGGVVQNSSASALWLPLASAEVFGLPSEPAPAQARARSASNPLGL